MKNILTAARKAKKIWIPDFFRRYFDPLLVRTADLQIEFLDTIMRSTKKFESVGIGSPGILVILLPGFVVLELLFEIS